MSRTIPYLILSGLLLLAVPTAHAGPLPRQALRPEVIDLDGIPRLQLESPDRAFRPVPFAVPGGKEGWIVRYVNPKSKASHRHVPSPAVHEGRVFVGGGVSSTLVESFDARTGRHLWTSRLRDNGPSSVADNFTHPGSSPASKAFSSRLTSRHRTETSSANIRPVDSPSSISAVGKRTRIS